MSKAFSVRLGRNLQLVSAGGAEEGAAAQGTADLVPNLLRNLGLPTDEATVNIARALLKNRLPVNAAMIEELQTALDELGAWTDSRLTCCHRPSVCLIAPPSISP